MKFTARGIIRATGIAAILAGALFVLVQVIHPPETVAAVAGDGWVPVHYLTIAMLALFVIGVSGIYARQVEQVGKLGIAGFAVLSFALMLNVGGAFIEAFVEPLLATANPQFVEAFNAMVMGTPYDYDLGALPAMWAASQVTFPAGTLLFGVAILRAGILSRWGAGVFAFGLAIGLPVASVIGNVRLAAVPISIGLVWLGYSLWSERRAAVETPAPGAIHLTDPASAA